MTRTKSSFAGSARGFDQSQYLLTEQLSVEQYGMRYDTSNVSPWKQKTVEKMKPREDEVRSKEEEFKKLQNDLKNKRPANKNRANNNDANINQSP